MENDTSFEQAACSFINPATAIGMYEIVARSETKAVILTAACSALCRMIERYFTSHGIKIINIVRRPEQVKLLEAEHKSKYILDSSEPDFLKKLKKMIKELKPTYFLDAVAGSLTGEIFNLMPRRSVVLVYGALSLEPLGGFKPAKFIFDPYKMLRGFYLTTWMNSLNIA